MSRESDQRNPDDRNHARAQPISPPPNQFLGWRDREAARAGWWTVRTIDRLWLAVLAVAALALYVVNLAGVPIADGQEGWLALTARTITRLDWSSVWSLAWAAGWPLDWLKGPDGVTLNSANGLAVNGFSAAGFPSFLTYAVAIAMKFLGENAWAVRLPGAVIAALAVPLVGLLGRSIFPMGLTQRVPGSLAALVFLVWLPVARVGRWGSGSGTIGCLAVILGLCVWRSRRDLRWVWGVGLVLGAIASFQGPTAIILAAIVLVFWAWDTPRLLRSAHLWLGLVLGLIPLLAWSFSQNLIYYAAYAGLPSGLGSGGQWGWPVAAIGWGLISGSNQPNLPPIDHLDSWASLLKTGWPWLVPAGFGLVGIWPHRAWGWAKFILVWAGGYGLASLVLGLALPTLWPGSVQPLYPPLALAAGWSLAGIWTGRDHWSGRFWAGLWWTIAIVGAVGTLYWIAWADKTDRDSQALLACLALGLTGISSARLAARQEREWLPVALWGCYISCVLLFSSSAWLWEMADVHPGEVDRSVAYAVRPVALALKPWVQTGGTVYTDDRQMRPSLNFYCDCHVVPVPLTAHDRHWRNEPTIPWLITRPGFAAWEKRGAHVVDRIGSLKILLHGQPRPAGPAPIAPQNPSPQETQPNRNQRLR